MNLIAFWLTAYFLCAYALFEIFPEARLSLGAKILRWCREWHIKHIGKILALEELEKDRHDLCDMQCDVKGFDETVKLILPDLIQEYGEAYAYQELGPESILEEMF